MSESEAQALQEAISAISQSDPLVKLLQEVRRGRLKPTDAGLQAVIESWMATYARMIVASSLTRRVLIRLDPGPRLDLLIEAGMLDPASDAPRSLQRSFDKQLADASPG